MALAFGGALGTKAASNVATTNFTTTANVTSGGLIVAGAGFYKSGTISSVSVSDGTLTWQTDKFATPNGGDPNYSVALFSATAPVGLSLGATLTLTLGGGGTGFAIGFCAVYFTGAASVTWVDAAGAGSSGASTAWTTNVTTTNANDVVVGYAWQDLWATANETPGAGWTEDAEFPNTTDTNDFVLVHQIVSSTGTYSPNGTFGGGSPYTAVAVAYKAAAGAVAARPATARMVRSRSIVRSGARFAR